MSYHKYQTYQYKSSSAYYIRNTIVTMRLTVTIDTKGQKQYNWERARTCVVVRDRRNNDKVAWKYSINNLLNIRCGDNLNYE
ncbi:hypothetical protein phiA047_0046 [Aeromonas phage phiA047]|nr:hypothetical protein phiA047_0046 [Aeromonas phage phiA047]